MVGVATALAPLQADHYSALLGSNSESWGWTLGVGSCTIRARGSGPPSIQPDLRQSHTPFCT